MTQVYLAPKLSDVGQPVDGIVYITDAAGWTITHEEDVNNVPYILSTKTTRGGLLKIEGIGGVSVPDSVDTEIYLEMYLDSASANTGEQEARMMARLTGTDSSSSYGIGGGLQRYLGRDKLKVTILSGSSDSEPASANASLASDQLVCQRTRVNGDVVSIKSWNKSSSEPVGWDVSTSITGEPTTSGGLALYSWNYHKLRIYAVGIGTNGDPALRSKADFPITRIFTGTENRSWNGSEFVTEFDVVIPEDHELLVVRLIRQTSSLYPVAPTVGGQSLTLLVEASDANSTNSAVYYMVNPPSGTQTMAMTGTPTNTDHVVIDAISRFGEIRAGGVNGSYYFSDSVKSVTTATQAGDLVLDCLASTGDSVTSVTESYTNQEITKLSNRAYFSQRVAETTSTTMAWRNTHTGGTFAALAVAVITPAPSGPVTPTNLGNLNKLATAIRLTWEQG